MENNIFDINMSELVHDNILSWIIRGINSSDRESLLYQFSVKFLRLMDIDTKNTKVIVKQQYKIDLGIKKGNERRSSGYVDILARFLNDKGDVEQYLVIEDKIYTEEHDDQFSRYITGILDDKDLNIRGNEEKVKNTHFVYIKLGKISNASKEKAETIYENNKSWKVISSKEILKIFTDTFQRKPLNDSVLMCYKEFLIDLEENYNSFSKTELDKWSEHSIFGFFDYLAKKNRNSNFQYKGFGNSGHGEFETNAVSLELSDKQKYNISIQLKLYAPVKTKIYSDEKEDKPRLDSWETSIVIKNVTNGTTETNNKIIEALKKYFNLNGNWSITESAKKYNECITICCKGIKEVDNKAFIENTENLIKSLYNIEIDEISRLVNEIL